MNDANVREAVRDRYADAARKAEQSCCSPDCSSEEGDFGRDLYPATDLVDVPSGASDASLGCGNPTAVAELSEGETVLDLGSGAGIDVLLSARRVGPNGFVYGIDMTDEMLELARRHAVEADASNVEFRKGYIEDIPLEAASVDVVISNCVINLSADKPKVFAEMARVLRAGGRIGISDVVSDDELSADEFDLVEANAVTASAGTEVVVREGHPHSIGKKCVPEWYHVGRARCLGDGQHQRGTKGAAFG